MKNKMKFAARLFLTCILLITTTSLLFAQPITDTVVAGGSSSFIDKIPAWVLPAVAGLYELLVRIIPTAKSWSILTGIITIIKKIIPDNSTVAVTKTTSTH